jgi:hypothetical protein
MSTTIRAVSGLLCLLLAGCAVFDKGRLDPRVASQVMVSKLDPPPGCEYLGAVKGVAPLGELGDAHGDVLRNAVLRGGNYIAVDLVERPVVLGLGSYAVHGRLFTCPVRAPAAASTVAQTDAPPAARPPAPPVDPGARRACDPECAPGFACQLGACIAVASHQAAGPSN